jgi:dihydropyrimidine dehydrogenase (NAD+) subunit PreA
MIGLENIELSDRPLEEWLPDISRIKKKYPENILITSVKAQYSALGWQKAARKVEEAGADAIELNLSCPHRVPGRVMGAAVGQSPKMTAQVVEWVKDVSSVPIIVKLTPNANNISSIARASEKAGADALSAINTVECLVGVDVHSLEPKPSVMGFSAFGGYSGPAVKPIALKCVAQVASSVKLPISAIGGITTWEDAVEFLLVGASTLQVCTAAMFNGYRIIEDLNEGLSAYMKEKGFESIPDIAGLVLPKIVDFTRLDTEHKMIPNIDEALCTGCGLCYIACRDAGYQAIEFEDKREPKILEKECTGCALCQQVCPIQGCITLKMREVSDSSRKSKAGY